MGIVKSAHDISEGGLAIALAEACISRRGSPVGASILLDDPDIRSDLFLFSESQSRAILTAKERHMSDIIKIAERHGISAVRIGVVAGERFRIEMAGRGRIIDVDIRMMNKRWREAIGDYV